MRKNTAMVYTVGKIFSRPFNGILQAPKFLIFQLVYPKNKYTLKFLSSDVPHYLMKHVGASLRGRAWKKSYVTWVVI